MKRLDGEIELSVEKVVCRDRIDSHNTRECFKKTKIFQNRNKLKQVRLNCVKEEVFVGVSQITLALHMSRLVHHTVGALH